MKSPPPLLAAHLSEEAQTLAICLRLQRVDGVMLGFTNHDMPIQYGSEEYSPVPGLFPMQMASSAALSVDNIEYEALIDSDKLKKNHLVYGVYDNAEITLILVNWAMPGDGGLILGTGMLGEISLQDSRFQTEMRSLSQYMQASIGRVVTQECDVLVFGEGRCGINKSHFDETINIDAVLNDYREFDVNTSESAGYYKGGVATFTNGLNANRAYSIKNHLSGGEIHLLVPTADPIAVGDNVNLVPGCDRKASTCKDKFNNFVNFQGFPTVPGRDSSMETPNAP